MPATVSVVSAPRADETRSLSPTDRPRSLASSVPIRMSLLVSRVLPRTMLSGRATIRKYSSGTMPISEIERLASPRTTSAEPVAAGDTTRTCHWSIDLRRCNGACTVAPSRVPGRAPDGGPSARATSFGGSSWMCGCAVSTRRTKLACSPASSADMNTITPTPMAMPLTMNSVCIRPSRRKRSATIHSNGSQGFTGFGRRRGALQRAGAAAIGRSGDPS